MANLGGLARAAAASILKELKGDAMTLRDSLDVGVLDACNSRPLITGSSELALRPGSALAQAATSFPAIEAGIGTGDAVAQQ